MALFALFRLVRYGDFRLVLTAAVSVAVVIGLFWLAQPLLKPLGNLNLVIFFVGVAGFCVFSGVPIAFGFGLAIFGYLALTNAIEDRNRADRAGSILVLVGSINVPIIYFSVNLWNTLHQGSSVNPVSGSKMATVMLLAMLVMSLAACISRCPATTR